MDVHQAGAPAECKLANTTHRHDPLVVVLTGPWGAGKTTVLNRIHARFVSDPERTLTIFAEFGEVNVDADRIDAKRMVEVKDRCICCHGAEALAEAVQRDRLNVDLIVIETSGVANSGNVRAVLSAIGMRHSIVALINSAEFSPEETEVLDAQVPASDVVVLTHHYWLGDNPQLSDPRLEKLNSYLKECTGRETADAFADADFGLSNETWRMIGDRAAPAEYREALDSAQLRQLSKKSMHGQAVLTVLLHDDCGLNPVAFEAALRGAPVRIGRAKGVLCIEGENGRELKHFDFVPGRSEDDSNLRSMRFTISERTSRAALFDGRPYAVICALARVSSLEYQHFLAIGLPNLSEQALDKPLSRYPDPWKIAAAGKPVPSYFKEGDRLYGVLYPLMERISEIPSPRGRERLRGAWRKVLGRYLEWRLEALKALEVHQDLPDREESRSLLAINLCWHLLHKGEEIPAETRDKILLLKPAHIFFDSCARLPHPPEFGGSRECSADARECVDAFAAHAIGVEGIDESLVDAAIRHIGLVDRSGTWEVR